MVWPKFTSRSSAEDCAPILLQYCTDTTLHYCKTAILHQNYCSTAKLQHYCTKASFNNSWFNNASLNNATLKFQFTYWGFTCSPCAIVHWIDPHNISKFHQIPVIHHVFCLRLFILLESVKVEYPPKAMTKSKLIEENLLITIPFVKQFRLCNAVRIYLLCVAWNLNNPLNRSHAVKVFQSQISA